MVEDWFHENEDKRKAQKRSHTLVWKILGIIAVGFAAFLILQLVTGRLGEDKTNMPTKSSLHLVFAKEIVF